MSHGRRPGGDGLLLLFDIDGTILAGAADAHRQALYRALATVHGLDSRRLPPLVPPAGRTDGEIVRLTLLEAGVCADQIDRCADEVREECCRAYARMCPRDLSRNVIPGMGELLTWLEHRPGARLGLLTGNYEPVARLKLTRARIGKHFPSGQGAFGSDSEDRAALPAIARRRAGAPGSPHPREGTVLIGDTPRDIACARADGVRCLAVTSGPYGAEDLRAADSVARGPEELRDALETLLTANGL